MTISSQRNTVFSGPTSNRSSTATWTAVSSIMASQGSNVENAAMNICWHFHANEDIFAPPVTRSGRLLSDLSRCGWESLKEFFKETVPENGAVPGAVIAIQTFGDFLGFNPHLHVLCSDGCFSGEGMFRVAPRFETKHIESIFRHTVF